MTKQIVYKASCQEAGESFFFLFRSIQTDEKKLKELGDDIASGWGAECIKVVKDHDQTVDNESIFDADKRGS